MYFLRSCVVAMAILGAVSAAVAQETPKEGATPAEFLRITPHDSTSGDMLTTKPASNTSALPPSPFKQVEASAPTSLPKPAPAAPAAALTPAPALKNGLPAKLPFGRASQSNGPAIPSGPHATIAVPVVDVDELEPSEPAPPTPTAPEADPAQEDPAEPTELTSPIFEEEQGTVQPRKITLRALNKVTAQSELISVKPNETVKFGQLEITAITCRVSAPSSQTDYAALLDISEKLPTKEGLKQLFRGWMYASSPSITALEHPVYDVTMVECKIGLPAPKKEEKEDEKPKAKPAAKSKEKPGKKAKN